MMAHFQMWKLSLEGLTNMSKVTLLKFRYAHQVWQMDSFCLNPTSLLFFFHLRVLLIGSQERLYNTLEGLYIFSLTCRPGMYEEHRFLCTECIFTSGINQKCLFPLFCFFSLRMQELSWFSLSGPHCFLVSLSFPGNRRVPTCGYILIKLLQCCWVARAWTINMTDRALNPGLMRILWVFDHLFIGCEIQRIIPIL